MTFSAFRTLVGEFPHLRLRIIGQRNVAQGGGDEAYQKQLNELALASAPVERGDHEHGSHAQAVSGAAT